VSQPLVAKFGQSLLALAIGTLFAVAFTECLLRLGAATFCLVQDQRGLHELGRKASQEGVVRVLCLGESTTALGGEDSFPRQLESVLNEIGGGRHFQVINKGIPGVDSSMILKELPVDLDASKPDVVVAMMGANDGAGAAVPRDTVAPAFADADEIRVLENMKVWKLARQLRHQFRNQHPTRAYFPEQPAPGTARVASRAVQGGRTPGALPEPSDVPLRPVLNGPNPEKYVPKRCLQLGVLFTAGRNQAVDRPGYARRSLASQKGCEIVDLLVESAAVGRRSDLPGQTGSPVISSLDTVWAFPLETYSLADEFVEVAGVYRSKGWSRDFLALLDDSLARRPHSSGYYADLAGLLVQKGGGWLVEGFLDRALASEPEPTGSARLHYILAKQLLADGSEQEALKHAEAAHAIVPDSLEATILVAECLVRLGRGTEAVARIDEAKTNPSPGARQLEQLLRLQHAAGHCDLGVHVGAIEADTPFDLATEEPVDPELLWPLALCDEALGRDDAADALFRRAWETSGSCWDFRLLVEFLDSSDRRAEIEEIFETMGDPSGISSCLLDRIIAYYDGRGEHERASWYQERGDLFSTVTRTNYERLWAKLTERGIPLLAVQYPLRTASSLKRSVPHGVRVVDNERSFEQRILEEGYSAVFWDACYGDFGHATRSGNRLLAENVAPALIAMLDGR
jgi:tetratricopeptide (TPR) repeat protein